MCNWKRNDQFDVLSLNFRCSMKIFIKYTIKMCLMNKGKNIIKMFII